MIEFKVCPNSWQPASILEIVDSVLKSNFIIKESYEIGLAFYNDGLQHVSFIIDDVYRLQFDYTRVMIKTFSRRWLFKYTNSFVRVSYGQLVLIIGLGIQFPLTIENYNTCTELVSRILYILNNHQVTRTKLPHQTNKKRNTTRKMKEQNTINQKKDKIKF